MPLPCAARHSLARLAWALLIFVLVFPTTAVRAHGEDTRTWLADTAVGPYVVSAISFPATLRPGATQFTVRVADATTGAAAQDLTVAIMARPTGANSAGTVATAVPAVDDHGDAVFAVALELVQAGAYEVTIRLADRTGMIGQAAFNADVFAAVPFQWLVRLLLLQALLVAGWLVKEGVTTWRPRPANSIDKGLTHGSDLAISPLPAHRPRRRRVSQRGRS